MFRLIILGVVLYVLPANAKEKWLDKILYPDAISHPSHEVVLQKTWGWSQQQSYEGFIVSITDLSEWSRFQIELSISDSYPVSTKEKDIVVPDGVSLIIQDIALDIGGVTVGQLDSQTTRKEFVVLPSLSIPLYQWELDRDVRKGFKLKFETRLGVGYQFLNYIDETEYTFMLLETEDGTGESFTLPYTGSGNSNSLAFLSSTSFNLGIVHINTEIIYFTPKGLRYLLGVGVRW